jgi:hypothetical protein
MAPATPVSSELLQRFHSAVSLLKGTRWKLIGFEVGGLSAVTRLLFIFFFQSRLRTSWLPRRATALRHRTFRNLYLGATFVVL